MCELFMFVPLDSRMDGSAFGTFNEGLAFESRTEIESLLILPALPPSLPFEGLWVGQNPLFSCGVLANWIPQGDKNGEGLKKAM